MLSKTMNSGAAPWSLALLAGTMSLALLTSGGAVAGNAASVNWSGVPAKEL